MAIPEQPKQLSGIFLVNDRLTVISIYFFLHWQDKSCRADEREAYSAIKLLHKQFGWTEEQLLSFVVARYEAFKDYEYKKGIVRPDYSNGGGSFDACVARFEELIRRLISEA